MTGANYADKESVMLLREINARLRKMQPLTFDEMSPERQRMAFDIAVSKAPLSEIYDRIETDPYIAELRRQEEAERLKSDDYRVSTASIDIRGMTMPRTHRHE